MSLPIDLLSFLNIGSVFTAFLATLCYLYYNWRQGWAEKLLALTLINLSLGLFVATIAIEGWFIYLPHLSRTGFLFALLLPPLILLYLEKGLCEKKFTSWDLIHLILPLIFLINFLPYYLSPASYKIQNFLNGNWGRFDEGWFLPKYVVNYLAFFQNLLYAIYIWPKFLFKSPAVFRDNKSKFVHSKILSAYLIVHFFPSFLSLANQFDGDHRTTFNLIFILAQLVFFVILLNQPKVLFSSPKILHLPSTPRSEEEPKDISMLPKLILKPGLSDSELRVIDEINLYFSVRKPFKEYDFGQKELSKDLGISEYLIRIHLNKAYGLSFTDFVNFKRIEYLLEMYESKPQWKNFHLNSLAQEIGFKSTNSLYLSFKKIMNKTPREVLDLIERREKIRKLRDKDPSREVHGDLLLQANR